ncbi:demethylmenaquinone methyltransferase-like [Gigantopelta aegis]|uniref:demethylmenaquinone methyltransferase-like n=1 Tax=Gigantopelta aegis TaxID=1735272 RepID=UPI001B8877B5|nr:demethylmenaquinone methyltransferase-like [Gigantopelta aegis]
MDAVVFADGASEQEKNESFTIVGRYIQKGLGNKKTVEVYDETSQSYDKVVKVANYNGPRELAKSMEELFPNNKHKLKILDAASGTGLSGEALYKAGFTNLDGVDASEKMLDLAKPKNIYQSLICEYLGENKLRTHVNDRIYDAVTMCGGVGQNHAPWSAFEELASVVKPGGLLLLVTREKMFDWVDEQGNNANRMFRKLTDEGKWKLESKKTFPDFLFGDEGVKVVFRML